MNTRKENSEKTHKRQDNWKVHDQIVKINPNV